MTLFLSLEHLVASSWPQSKTRTSQHLAGYSKCFIDVLTLSTLLARHCDSAVVEMGIGSVSQCYQDYEIIKLMAGFGLHETPLLLRNPALILRLKLSFSSLHY